MVTGLVLISPALPSALRPPAKPHELRAVPELYRRDEVGWAGLPEAIRRRNPDLSVADVLRIQHMMGAESGLARRDVIAGIPIDRGAMLGGLPALVIGGGLDRDFPEPDSERLAEWLGAEYQPYGAHSHYGLVIGEDILRAGCGLRAKLPRRPPTLAARGRSGARSRRLHARLLALSGPIARDACRIRLEAQDTALSRRRSSVRIRYAVPP